MYNNDVYSAIIEESKHIQDAILQGGGSSPIDYTNILNLIASNVDDLNAAEKSRYFNRCIVKTIDSSQFVATANLEIQPEGFEWEYLPNITMSGTYSISVTPTHNSLDVKFNGMTTSYTIEDDEYLYLNFFLPDGNNPNTPAFKLYYQNGYISEILSQINITGSVTTADASIASLFDLPTEGLDERFFDFSLYAYSRGFSSPLDKGCNLYVKDATGHKFYISDRGTFSPSMPLSRQALTNLYLEDPSFSLSFEPEDDAHPAIVGIFHYLSTVV